MVDGHRPCPVAAAGVQAHEQPVGRLAQRIAAQRSLRHGDRPGPVTPGLGELGELGELAERVEVALPQPVPQRTQPLVVVALQQVARVQRDRRVQRILPVPRFGEEPLELLDVDPAGHLGAPPQRGCGDLQVAVRAGYPGAQRVQEVPQVGAGLRLGRLRPEQPRDPLPRHRAVAVQHQVGEQHLRPRGVGPGSRRG